MTIRELIEAGKYPRDSKGRALVPLRSGGTATIYATDANYRGQPIAGLTSAGLATWHADGRFYRRDDIAPEESALDLMPPAPRKEPVNAWAVMSLAFVPATFLISFPDRAQAERYADQYYRFNDRRARVVELTGEMEIEP